MSARPIDQIQGFIVDLDGTTYLSDELVPGADDFYHAVRDQGKRLLFLSNNSSHTPEECCAKLRAIGIPVERDEVFTCAEATLAYLKERHCRTVFPLATAAFRGMMSDAGFELTAEGPEYVVLGYDTELTYEKLKTACLLLTKGAGFVVSNPDVVHPSAEGPVPHTGSILAMLRAATGREPDAVVGKPSPLMLGLALERLELDRRSLAVVGDQLSTDIAMAAEAGMTSILVFTGVAQPEDADRSPYRIDYRFPSVAGIVPLLRKR